MQKYYAPDRKFLAGACINSMAVLLLLNLARPMTLYSQVSSNIKLAYNATLIYPGFRVGIEHPVKSVEWTRFRRHRSVRHFTRERLWSIELGYYHHPTFHDNWYMTAGWVMRKRFPHGFFAEWSPALGYSRTFLGGETYYVDDRTGEVKLRKAAGYNYVALTLGGGIGLRLHTHASGYIRPSLLVMYPSNNIVYVRPTVELGCLYTPESFWKTTPKYITKSRGKKS